MRKMYANANLLLRKISKCSVNVKCYLFKTYCSILYCAPMWFDCTKTALTKLKVAYNNSLRRFMSLPWHNSASEMFVNINKKSFDELLRVFVTVFVQGFWSLRFHNGVTHSWAFRDTALGAMAPRVSTRAFKLNSALSLCVIIIILIFEVHYLIHSMLNSIILVYNN